MKTRARRTRRRPFAVALGVAALLAGCGGSGLQGAPRLPTLPAAPTTAQPAGGGASGGGAATAPPASTPTGTVAWSRCTASGLASAQCATLPVPLNPANPAGATIGLALDRIPAKGTRLGSLLINPGGPGASGVDELPALYGALSPDVQDHFDIVGFDPPGVGHSEGVQCLSGPALYSYLSVNPVPTTAAGFSALLTANQQFAKGCEAESGKVLPYVSTRVAAHDMDLIRIALGDPKLNFLGFSYGTFLGATYAEEFPTHIRAMVLDGALDPTLNVVSLVDEQAASLEGELNSFFTSCTQSATCVWKPSGSPLADYERLLAKVTAQPLAVHGTTRTVGPAALLYGTGDALYTPSSWGQLAQALEQAENGNGTGLLTLFDDYTQRNANGTYADISEAETAVDCLDNPVPSVAQIQADAPAAAAAAPVFGVMNLYSELVCDVWPVPATGAPQSLTAPGSPPIVVVGSTGDPVTPYSWAQHLSKTLSNSVLLTRTGNGHTAYFFSQCIDNQLDVYLIDLRPPAGGTVCASGSAPNPTST